MQATVGTEYSENKSFSRLAAINRAITTSLNFNEVLQLIVVNAAELFSAKTSLLLLSDGDDILRVKASYGRGNGRVRDFTGEMTESTIRDLSRRLNLSSTEEFITVPVMANGSLNGFLAIVRESELNQDEQWQIASLADQAAIALNNARFHEMETGEAWRQRDETLKALRESNHKTNRILESITDLFYQLDGEWRFIDANKRVEALFGKTREELIGQVIWEVYPQTINTTLHTRFLEAMNEKTPAHFEVKSTTVPGAWFEAHAYPSESTLSVYLRDITERKRAEEERSSLLAREREARAEAERANALKDEFLATLSHELRNPLNVITGYAEVLLRCKEAEQSEFLRQAARVLKQNALAQSQLIADLLDLSRLNMGKLALSREPVALATVISDAIETVRANAETRKIKIELHGAEEVLLVDGDALRLGQIVWNLLNNAVKFTPPGGAVDLNLSRERKHAVLVVKDTGEGIDPLFLPRVFEMFRQADASSRRKHGGLGIGLALVRQLVKLHGGTVTAKSEGVGKGAEFTIQIPLSEETKPRPKTRGQLEVNAALNHLSILIVDDSEDTIAMLKYLLELEGATVISTTNGVEALKIAAEKDFDVVVTDISMPLIDGFEFLRRLRLIPSQREVPVIALTGYGRLEDMKRAKAAGFFSHVTKPLDTDDLFRIMRTVAPNGMRESSD
jgi:PAS domain S-box-containing protein